MALTPEEKEELNRRAVAKGGEVIFDPIAATGIDPTKPAAVSVPGVPAEKATERVGEMLFPETEEALGRTEEGWQVTGVAPTAGSLPRTSIHSPVVQKAIERRRALTGARREEFTPPHLPPGPEAAGAMAATGASPIDIARRLRGQTTRELTGAAEKQREAIDAAEEIGVMKAADERAYAQERQKIQEEEAEKLKAVEVRVAESVKQAEENLRDAAETRRFNITPELRRHHQSIVSSPYTSPEQKVKSAKVLENAQKIDPDRIFGGNTAAKVMSVIAMFLGGMSKTGRNTPMAVIGGLIQNDIAAQKASFEKNASAYETEKSIYAEMMRRFGDIRQATQAATVAELQAVSDKYDMFMADIKGAEAQQRGMASKADIDMKLAEERSKLHQMVADTEIKSILASKRTGLGPTGLPVGLIGQPITKQAMNKAAGAYGSALSSGAILNNLLEHRREHWWTLPFTEATETGKSLATQFHLEMKNLAELGVLAGPDMEILTNLVPADPGQIGHVEAKLLEAQRYVDKKLRGFLKGRGMDVDQDAYRQQVMELSATE
jgi:hypothetical protein